MHFVGLQIQHKIFGKGVIAAVAESGAKKIISVKFAEKTAKLIYFACSIACFTSIVESDKSEFMEM